MTTKWKTIAEEYLDVDTLRKTFDYGRWISKVQSYS